MGAVALSMRVTARAAATRQGGQAAAAAKAMDDIGEVEGPAEARRLRLDGEEELGLTGWRSAAATGCCGSAQSM
jgi:hypothetical protein